MVGGKLMEGREMHALAVVSFGEFKSNWKREGEL